MKNKLLSYLGSVSKELWLIFSIVASAGIFNYFIGGQRLILTFYNIPTFFAAYYFGRQRAVEAALGSILFITWVDLMNPTILGRQSLDINGWLSWSDLTIWAALLLISAYAAGTLHETAQRRLSELRQTYTGLLQILSQIIANDKFTQNHSYRVSVYATQIAGEMGFGEDQIEDIRAAALLHDIGKLETSREVLYKAAKLTDDEMSHMKTHVQKGVDLLSPVAGSLRRILPIILAHHDKFDGSGYHSTEGEDIPIEARILSVADVYDSLVSDRPYRKGLSPFEARDIIVKGDGSDFDPRIIRAFESAFKKQRLEIPEVLV
jgi:putative nucleotidyltransferase with HDIG domain